MKASQGGWGSNNRVHFQEPYSKMPKSSGSGKLAVPSWEREFCESVGVSWDQVCENNNDLEGFEPILWWNDSAALEAFQMAKQRYWAKRNAIPCDIPLPGPDLYIDEINWDSQNQQVYDFPERNYSSSEEEYRRPYFKRGRRGRQGRGRTMSRYESRDYRKPSDGNVQCSVRMTIPTGGWLDTNNNTPQDAQVTGATEWHDNKQNLTEMSKDFAQNSGNFAISPTGWEDQHNSGWDAKETDNSGWEPHENNNMLSVGWDQKVASGWGDQIEPTRNSTVTTKTGWTDSGDLVSTSVGWGDQKQNGWNLGASGSGWTPYEENYTAQGWGNVKDSGRDATVVDRTGWTNAKSVSGWESAKGTATCFIPQDQGWGPEPVHPYYQNQAFMSAQWNSMPHAAQQWQNQSVAWNVHPAENEYQFDGNWGGPSCNSFHQQGSQTWIQPSAYPQTTWQPIHSNQGYWQPVTQHKQGGYPAQNHHYALKKDRDFKVNNRRNPR